MELAVATIFRRYRSNEVRFAGDIGALTLNQLGYKRGLEITGDGAVLLLAIEGDGVKAVVNKCGSSWEVLCSLLGTVTR